MTRQEAMELLKQLPLHGARTDNCEIVNPALFRIWSQIKGRLSGATVWTEVDVAESARLMLVQHIRNAVTGNET